MDHIMEHPVYQKIIDSEILRIFKSVEKQITKNLRDCQIVTRPCKSNGLWCCLLLPTVLVLYSKLYKVSELYTLLAYISIGLLSYCFLFSTFVSVTCLVLTDNTYGGCAASSLVATLFLYSIQGQDFLFSIIVSLIAVYSFSALLRLALVRCPKTFTVGEAMIVTQSIILFGVMTTCKILFNMGDKQDDETKFVNAVLFTILSSVGIIVTALYVLDERQKTLATLWYILGIAGIYALLILHIQFGVSCILQIASYVLLDTGKIKLFLFWLILVVISVFIVMIRTNLNVKASTVTRKTFHILASVVFLSGILYDIQFMTLAAGVGFGLMILVEALRKSGIQTISPALQAAFDVYSDEKDVGCFAMTPIYLYVGLACPLVLVPVHQGYELELLSGVLSIGVGDTAASWFGSKYGFNKWADGKKTVEGTAFNILSQIAVIYFIQVFGFLEVSNALLRVAVTAAISGLVEAKTNQVDNLILPLVSLIGFQATAIIA